MTTVFDTVMVLHTVFAAIWTGGTLLIAGAILPAARRGSLDGDALRLVGSRFWYTTIASVLILLMTGGHLAGTLYTFDALQTTGRGHLVLTMTGLWLVLTIILYVGTRPLRRVPADGSAVTAATSARPWFLAGSAVSLVLLVLAGLL